MCIECVSLSVHRTTFSLQIIFNGIFCHIPLLLCVNVLLCLCVFYSDCCLIEFHWCEYLQRKIFHTNKNKAYYIPARNNDCALRMFTNFNLRLFSQPFHFVSLSFLAVSMQSHKFSWNCVICTLSFWVSFSFRSHKIRTYVYFMKMQNHTMATIPNDTCVCFTISITFAWMKAHLIQSKANIYTWIHFICNLILVCINPISFFNFNI